VVELTGFTKLPIFRLISVLGGTKQACCDVTILDSSPASLTAYRLLTKPPARMVRREHHEAGT
jgi:hypothetical protein